MVTSPILDLDIRDKDIAYDMFVLKADEVDRVLFEWYTQSRGRSPMKHDFRHIYWRIVDERQVWGTLRNALQTTWPLVSGGGSGVPPPHITPPSPQPSPSGSTGFRETAGLGEIRPRQNAQNIPKGAGPFIADRYGTPMVRLVGHGEGKVYAAGYPYWPMINQHSGRHDLRVMLSIDSTLHVVTVDKATRTVAGREALPFNGTGEKVYWSLSNPDILYVPHEGGLVTWDVVTHELKVVVPTGIGANHFTTSHDGRVHAFILEGHSTVSVDGAIKTFHRKGDLDEPQVDKSGEWLVSKEIGSDGRHGNRVIHIPSEREWWVLKSQGGVGHSDTGWACLLGEDDVTDPGGVIRLWLFPPGGIGGPIDAGTVFHWGGWKPSLTRYVSFCNAQNATPQNQRAVISSAFDGDRLHANEIIEIYLDGSLRGRAVAPNYTDLNVPNIEAYWRHPRANVCPTGDWVCWTANTAEGIIPLLGRLR